MNTPEWLDPKTLRWVCNYIDETINQKSLRIVSSSEMGRHRISGKIDVLKQLSRSLSNRCSRLLTGHTKNHKGT
jgi:hypothetical protein